MTRPRLASLIGLFLGVSFLLAWPQASLAQTVVVGQFKDKTSRGLGKKARAAVAAALADQGATLFSATRYKKQASRKGVRGKQLWSARGIRRVARGLGIEGVVLGSARRSGSRHQITLLLRGSNGKLWLKQVYTTRGSALAGGDASDFATRVLRHLGPGNAPIPAEQVADAPTVDEELALFDRAPTEVAVGAPPPPQQAPAEDGALARALADTMADDKNVAGETERPPAPPADFGEPMPGLNDSKPTPQSPPRPGDRPAANPEPTVPPPPSRGADDWAREDGNPAPRPGENAISARRRAPAGDRALVSIGLSLNQRSGLEPKHATAIFPGLRFDGQLFAGAFTRQRHLENLGLAVMIDTDLGLEYRYRGQDTTFKAEQTHWRVDLLYRLALKSEFAPTLVFKTGVGGVTSEVSNAATFAVDAVYTGWRLGLDARWAFYKDMLGFVLSPTLLVAKASGDLDATAAGVNFFLGLDATLVKMLHLGLGYDLTHFGFDDKASGSKADTYHAFFLRVGYAYR